MASSKAAKKIEKKSSKTTVKGKKTTKKTDEVIERKKSEKKVTKVQKSTESAAIDAKKSKKSSRKSSKSRESKDKKRTPKEEEKELRREAKKRDKAKDQEDEAKIRAERETLGFQQTFSFDALPKNTLAKKPTISLVTIRGHVREAIQSGISMSDAKPEECRLPGTVPHNLLRRIIEEESEKLRHERKNREFFHRASIQTEFRLRVEEYTRDWNVDYALMMRFMYQYCIEAHGIVMALDNAKVWTDKVIVDYALGLATVWVEFDALVFRPVLGAVVCAAYREDIPTRGSYIDTAISPGITLDWCGAWFVNVLLGEQDVKWLREQNVKHGDGVWIQVTRIKTPLFAPWVKRMSIDGALLKDRPLQKNWKVADYLPQTEEKQDGYIQPDELYEFSESSDDEAVAEKRRKRAEDDEENPLETDEDDEDGTVNRSKERRFYPDNDNDDTDAVDTRPEDASSRSSDLSMEDAADPKELANEALDLVQQGPILDDNDDVSSSSDDESSSSSSSSGDDESENDRGLLSSSSSSDDEQEVKSKKPVLPTSDKKKAESTTQSSSKKRKRKESSTRDAKTKKSRTK